MKILNAVSYDSMGAVDAAKALFEYVLSLPKQMINDSLARVVEEASSKFNDNLPEALGLLALINDFHCENGGDEFMGFVGPQIIADISNHIRHQLRMGYAPGIEVYARLSKDPSFNYTLRSEYLSLEDAGVI